MTRIEQYTLYYHINPLLQLTSYRHGTNDTSASNVDKENPHLIDLVQNLWRALGISNASLLLPRRVGKIEEYLGLSYRMERRTDYRKRAKEYTALHFITVIYGDLPQSHPTWKQHRQQKERRRLDFGIILRSKKECEEALSNSAYHHQNPSRKKSGQRRRTLQG
ncbi:hypothetical protein Tco_0807549 [Tanacetum coccineum]